jgi:hypothetical protein
MSGTEDALPDVVERLWQTVHALRPQLERDVGTTSGAAPCAGACRAAGEDGALLQVWMPCDAAPDGSPILTAQVRAAPTRRAHCGKGRRGAWRVVPSRSCASPHRAAWRPKTRHSPRPRGPRRHPRQPLHPKGLPNVVAGASDLLALFRCVSCRYRFSGDPSKPALMGAIGRVFASGQVGLQRESADSSGDRAKPAQRPPHGSTSRSPPSANPDSPRLPAAFIAAPRNRMRNPPTRAQPLAPRLPPAPIFSPLRASLIPSPTTPHHATRHDTRPRQPEMSNNVQKYDKAVYLRASEALRCRVHSTLVMPVFPQPAASGSGAAGVGSGSGSGNGSSGKGGSSGAAAPPVVAVLEVVQGRQDVDFVDTMRRLRRCLEVGADCVGRRAMPVAWAPLHAGQGTRAIAVCIGA